MNNVKKTCILARWDKREALSYQGNSSFIFKQASFKTGKNGMVYIRTGKGYRCGKYHTPIFAVLPIKVA